MRVLNISFSFKIFLLRNEKPETIKTEFWEPPLFHTLPIFLIYIQENKTTIFFLN